MLSNNTDALSNLVSKASVVRLFLDYDGTLARFAPTPDTLLPDEKLISIITRLVAAEGILPAVISGRRLSHIQKLLPVKGLLMGGTYGIEMQLADGQLRNILPFEEIRPTIEKLIPRLQKMIGNREGFFLEDKGWALAIHGRRANPQESESVIETANQELRTTLDDPRFHIFIGDRFLEIAPVDAKKAVAVRWVINHLTPENAAIVYIGDDDKDEDAFSVVNEFGGFSVRVSTTTADTLAQYRMKDPAEVRNWLEELLLAHNA